MYKVNREKCIGCGLCLVDCPDSTELKENGKAEIINQKKLEDCGGEKVCPYGAIEKVDKAKSSSPPSPLRGLGK